MKIAFIGKGGSGKSTIAGNLCRILADKGHQILAIDTDSVPGLAYSLGVEAPDPEKMSAGAIFVPKKGWEMVVTAREAVEHYSVEGPGGIRFMQFRKVTVNNDRQLQASVIVLFNVIKEFERKGWSVVIDLAAGVRQAYTGWTGGKTTFLLVVEPSIKSFFVARRAVKLMDKRKKIQILGIANKVESPRHRRMIAAELERLKIPYWAEVPSDPELAAAEREGLSAVEAAVGSNALKAIEKIADRLLRMQREEARIERAKRGPATRKKPVAASR